MRSFPRIFTVLTVIPLLWHGCVNEKQGSIFDPNASFGPAPSMSSITPSNGAQAGVDTLTITGLNFSPTPQYNFVYFNSTVGALLQVSPTQLLLKAPFVLGDSVRVRIAVQGVDQLSNTMFYKLSAAIVGFGSLAPLEFGKAIATDAAGNLYLSITTTNDRGVRMFTPAGDTMTYAPPTSGITEWFSLKMGPGGYLYAVRNARAVFRYNPGGGNSLDTAWIPPQLLPSSARIVDIDFDANQNLWGVGSLSGNAVFSIKQDRTVKAMPFTGTVRSVRVFNGYLYMSVLKDGAEGLWRAQIIADSLATPEKYFDFATAFPGKAAQGITFSSDGNLYIATSAPEGLVIVTPSKTFSAAYGAYSSFIGTGLKSFAWGSADALYTVSANGILSKINTRTMSAPYFGQ